MGEYVGGMWPRRKLACLWNRVGWRALVRWSAMLIDVFIRSRIMGLHSTQSQSKKYLMSLCHIQLVGFGALHMAMHPSMSS